MEIMSGGRLVATPHAVMSKGSLMGGRASLAVFLQPELDQALPECPSTADASLQARYRPTFGAFQKATTQAFQLKCMEYIHGLGLKMKRLNVRLPIRWFGDMVVDPPIPC